MYFIGKAGLCSLISIGGKAKILLQDFNQKYNTIAEGKTAFHIFIMDKEQIIIFSSPKSPTYVISNKLRDHLMPLSLYILISSKQER